jgi:methionyl-tRNA formyltransferase
MKKIKIGYFADGPWSHNALDLLLNDTTIEIAFIIPRNDTKDEYLKNEASKNNIKYLTPIKVNSDEFFTTVKNIDCDLFVSMSFNQIFKQKIITLPKYSTINCHAGKLPFYRGRNILNWVLINDEMEFGITVHYVDEGIDTGDIILQRTFPITDEDDYNSLLNIAYKECAKILYDSIKLIQKEEVKRIPQSQISKYGMYCGIRKAGDEKLSWHQSSRDIFNFVRALAFPGPMAVTFCNQNLIYVNKVIYNQNFYKYKGIPGQVLGYDSGFPIIKTLDSIILLADYKSEYKLKTGDRLTMY